VVERDGYAAVIHKSLPIDITTAAKRCVAGHAVRSVLLDSRQARFVSPDWLASVGRGQEKAFLADQYVVAVATSSRYYIGAVAALPTNHLTARVHAAAKVVVPWALLPASRWRWRCCSWGGCSWHFPR